jgi:uncharacterized protein
MSPPELGVGFIYLPGLEAFSQRLGPAIDVVEIEPQTFWSHRPADDGGAGAFHVDRSALERALALGRPVLVHSVGYPVGGSADGDKRHRAALAETFEVLKPAWWSEHMSFLAAPGETGPRHLGFLMPPVQSLASGARIADRIKRLQDDFGLPFAFETGVNYLRPAPGELSDGDFWALVSERADCGILLDLHNLWANALNGRQSVEEAVGRLPLERVWEMHVAGGQWHKGYWLDSHSGLPPDEIFSLASAVVPRLPALRAILFEIIPDQIEARAIGEEEIALCLERLRTIWRTRGSASAPPGAGASAAGGEALPAMEAWERTLAEALAGGGDQADPGFEIYRDLIGMARRGTLAEALPLSMRYLYRALGPAGLEQLFASFWRRASPEPFMSDEALSFAGFVGSEIRLPHLDEVIAFELAAHRAAMTGLPQYVPFTCEPEPLLMSLKTGASPLEIRPAEIEVEVTPPAASRAAAA